MKPKSAALALLAVGIVFLAAAVFPLTRGGSVSLPFLLLAGVFIVLAPIAARMIGSTDSHPPAA